MNLQGERHIPASIEATWAALNDPEVLKQCIAGCESLERTGDNQFQSTMAVRIGPVNARFKGKLELQNIVPMDSYTIAFEGQGGVAGFAAADIVLDQFRLGSYGVAACEAMASARVVVGHVLPAVRERVREATGLELPIVEATPDTLAAVLEELISDPEGARRIAARGSEFVEAVHDGRASARALIDGWIRPSD